MHESSEEFDLIALSLLHTYDLLYLYCYPLKKERTDPGAPPWTMDRVDSELAKRLRGNLTKISHVIAHRVINFSGVDE